MGQLAEIAPVGEDAISKLLRPFQVTGYGGLVFSYDCTACLQLKHRA